MKSSTRIWLNIILCFIVIFVALGFCSSNRGLYLSAITEALQIPRSLFSLQDTFRYASSAIVNMFFGVMVMRFGNKKLMMMGVTSLILCMVLYATSTNIIGFYIGSILLGVGLAWCTTTMVGSIVHRYAPADRVGTLMGAVLCANGLGSAVATQIVSPIIYEEGNLFGYRNAYKLIVAILVVVLILVAVFFKEKVEGVGDVKYTKKKKNPKGDWKGITFREAIRKPYFYIAMASVALACITLQATTSIGYAQMRDVGIDAAYIAIVASVHSIALAVLKLGMGIANDKLSTRASVLICNVGAVIALYMLATLTNSAIGRVMTMCYGVISSLALPMETVLLPLLTEELFGNVDFDKLLGITISIGQIGLALGAPIVNLGYDMTGSYKGILFIYCGIAVVIAVMFQLAMRAARKER
ncbi:MAG: MFS transporter [Clostridia bacterium]|nr:MFS transporter [Clostridia bacterium]